MSKQQEEKEIERVDRVTSQFIERVCVGTFVATMGPGLVWLVWQFGFIMFIFVKATM